MSLRGPRGGRIRGRGSERGRGRGRGARTIKWEWQNNYSPGPEVYDQLWHIRQAPATVTPYLPTECPIPDAQSRIKDRRQTEGEVLRNFYVVEVTHFGARASSASSADDPQESSTETLHVDLSRILEYVSPEELERFENEQFRIEAEAEAVAKRIEAEEEARKQREKNARANAIATGSRMLTELTTDTPSRSRGRPRGRGRGRGRGSWRGRGALMVDNRSLLHGDTQEELVGVESEEVMNRDEEVLELAILETESESEESTTSELARLSPTIARSSFVANSALPLSPVLSHRRASAMFSSQQRASEESSEGESNVELIDADAESMSSAAMQLRDEDDGQAQSREDSYPRMSQSKRYRTESTTSSQHVAPTKSSVPILQRNDHQSSLARSVLETPSDVGAESSDEDVPAHAPRNSRHIGENGTSDPMDHDSNWGSTIAESADEEQNGDASDSEDLEEYVVEGILEHYRDAGKKYYLVKWQGYEDSHDWLPEEDLEGAAELVAEYNARVRKRKAKQKMRD